MQGFSLDLRSAFRQLVRAPWTTLAAVLTLAVGIGATTAVFSLTAAVMSAASPVGDMDRRVALWSHNRGEAETKNAVSEGDFLEWRRRATLLDEITATRRRSVNIGGDGTPVRTGAQEVTPGYFAFFQWNPLFGRRFVEADAVPGAPRVVILSYEFWQNAMAAQDDVIGTTIRLDGEPAAIVGVLPRMPAVDGIYLPLALDPARGDRATRNLFVWGRLRDGASIEQLRAEMDSIGQALEREFPQSHRGWSVNTRPLQEEYVGPQARLAFGVLIGTVLAVLLIGCVNIANLYLARGIARRGELAVRLALGAGGWRLARQLLAECGLVAIAGAAASLLVSRWTVQLLLSVFPIDSPWVASGGLNLRALLFTGAATILATVVSGLIPALAARRTSLMGGLYATGRSGASGNRRLMRVLVAAEIALAVLLLIVAGLLMRTLVALERLDPGFDTRNLLTASVTLPQRLSETEVARWIDEVVARARALPGVASAGATSRLPFAGGRFNPNRGLEIEGRAVAGDAEGTWAVDYIVSPGFLETLHVAVLAGRTFDETDGTGAPLVAVINQAMARRFWPGRSPIGARLRRGDEPAGEWRTIVGVVADIRNDDADQPPLPYLYVPLAQRPVRTVSLALRAGADVSRLAAPLRRSVAAFDPDQALYDVRTMDDVLASDLAGSRVLIQIMAAFAAIALGLAGLGVWSMAAHSVAQRTREIGVRVALGARARTIALLVAWQGLLPVALGLGAGLTAGLAVAQVLQSVLFQVSPTDPITLALTLAALAAVGFAATIGPALRAARLDPLVALRTE